MEFHVSREVRSKFGVDDVLFNYAGNAIFGNLAASREFARKAGTVVELNTGHHPFLSQPAAVQNLLLSL